MIISKIRILLFLIPSLIIGIQNVRSQEDDCLVDILASELQKTNSNKLYDYFETHTERRFEAWKVLLKADQETNRLNLEKLKDVEDYLSFKKLSAEGLIAKVKASGLNYSAWRRQVEEISLSKMLQNDNFKEIYENFKNKLIHRRFAELKLEEEAILHFYTRKTYYKFNNALNNNSKREDILELEQLLNKTLHKISSSPATYNRGVGYKEIEYLLSIGKGGTVVYKNFLSTSSSRELAMEYVVKNKEKTGKGALVKVISKHGKSIIKYSQANESEFLHKSKTEFIIKDIEVAKESYSTNEGVVPKGYYVFTIEEK